MAMTLSVRPMPLLPLELSVTATSQGVHVFTTSSQREIQEPYDTLELSHAYRDTEGHQDVRTKLTAYSDFDGSSDGAGKNARHDMKSSTGYNENSRATTSHTLKRFSNNTVSDQARAHLGDVVILLDGRNPSQVNNSLASVRDKARLLFILFAELALEIPAMKAPGTFAIFLWSTADSDPHRPIIIDLGSIQTWEDRLPNWAKPSLCSEAVKHQLGRETQLVSVPNIAFLSSGQYRLTRRII
ncbi:hypothetical protein AC578_6143 [Pseudocercospora eumusae]|uniref:Uncharacterized protein n=1 Tax=Pseudocercospora eumusae TaxID=321146 RepID=A0A139H9B4_9PEZI|nr:hypothetical protein AC578_6143 [Pseudocercospora eumusae]